MAREKTDVKLDSHNLNIVDISKQYSEDEWIGVTLKDISILLYMSCGEGVMWNLAYELSEQLNIDYGDIVVALFKIVHAYKNASDEEAINNFFATPIPSDETLRLRNEQS